MTRYKYMVKCGESIRNRAVVQRRRQQRCFCPLAGGPKGENCCWNPEEESPGKRVTLGESGTFEQRVQLA